VNRIKRFHTIGVLKTPNTEVTPEHKSVAADSQMNDNFMGFRQYCYECCRVGWQSSWRSISKITGAILIAGIGAWLGPIVFLYDQPGFHSFVSGTLSFILYAICTWLALFLLATIFTAPYRIWKSNKEQIKELEKVGKGDLERILGGKYINGGTAFFYTGGDFGRVCRQFKCKGDIESLKDVFTAIPVQAPKGAIAHINFQFSNSRQSAGERCHFYVMKNGEPIEIEDIYGPQLIGLDQDGCFRLKLSWGDNYKLEDHASLLITVDSWTK
jgi:hypothetical protein